MSGSRTSLVVLAAGRGSRFGGLKQLVAVGTDGATIMDVLARRAAAAGFERAVIVVAPDTERLVRAHLGAMRAAAEPIAIPVELAVQPLQPGRSRPLGTAAAVLAAREAIDGSFAVVNADDLYPADAFTLLNGHLRDAPASEHAMVGFRVGRTLTGSRPVSRALVEVDPAGALVAIGEGSVVQSADGLRFEADASTRPLPADRCVSMNMWGFRPPVFDELARAVSEFVAEGHVGEVYLPDVVATLVQSGAVVRVLMCESSCIGVTHEEDIAAVRSALS